MGISYIHTIGILLSKKDTALVVVNELVTSTFGSIVSFRIMPAPRDEVNRYLKIQLEQLIS